MWTVEVHDERMQQAIEDEQDAAKARKYGNSIPRHNSQGSTVALIGNLLACLPKLSMLFADASGPSHVHQQVMYTTKHHSCILERLWFAVALASAGLLIANHARTGPGSLISRVCKRFWDDGQKKEETPAGQRKKVLAAAESRKKKEVPYPLVKH